MKIKIINTLFACICLSISLFSKDDVEVSIEWKDGELNNAVILSKSNNTIKVRYKNISQQLNLSAGEKIGLNNELQRIFLNNN